MPVETSIPLQPISHAEFAKVAYEVVGSAFEVHRQFGPTFHECVYRQTLAHIHGRRATEEVCIRLTPRDFEKSLFIDLVIDDGCPFELKVTQMLHDRHRSQLIQYLMLTGLTHGKLINFGSDRVEHEFVNCHDNEERRRSFRIELSRWPSRDSQAHRFQVALIDLLTDWGTGLDRVLYIEAMIHFLGGPTTVRQPVEVHWQGAAISRQWLNVIQPRSAFEITCLKAHTGDYETHLRSILANTVLSRIYWGNIVSGEVTLTLLTS